MNQHNARLLPFTRRIPVQPAGQTSSTWPPNTYGYDDNGYCVDSAFNVLDSSGNVVGGPGTRPSTGARCQTGGSSSGGTTPTTDQANLYRTVDDIFGRAAGATQAIITSGNNVAIEQIRQDAAVQIAALNNQAAAATAAGNTALALQLHQQENDLQRFRDQTASAESSQKIVLYVVGGVLVLGALGLGAYVLTRPRRNPVVGRGRHRHYVKAKSRRQSRRH